MKLSINYDLMEQIALSEKGYTLSKDINRITLLTAISSSIVVALEGFPVDPKALITQTIFQAAFHIFYHSYDV